MKYDTNYLLAKLNDKYREYVKDRHKEYMLSMEEILKHLEECTDKDIVFSLRKNEFYLIGD